MVNKAIIAINNKIIVNAPTKTPTLYKHFSIMKGICQLYKNVKL